MTIKINYDETDLFLQGPGDTQRSHHHLKLIDSTVPTTAIFGEQRDIETCSRSAGARLFISSLLKNDTICLQYGVAFEGPELCLSEDDNYVGDDTTITSYASTIGDDNEERRVRFCEPLVSEVKTRPKTPEEDLHLLFYTYEETYRFRQEYKAEKKLLSLPDNDGDESGFCVNETSSQKKESFLDNRKGRRHRISHVVVEHNDTQRTFYNDDLSLSFRYNLDKSSSQDGDPIDRPCNEFFDNDSFWSGSITWY